MARSWHYPRWKRIALQVVLVLTLGLTLGLAEAVVHHKRAARQTVLSGPTAVGSIQLHIPDRWVIERVPPGPTVIQEPDRDSRTGRTLEVEERSVLPDIPLEQLVSVRPPWTWWVPSDGISGRDRITIGGRDAILVASRDTAVDPATGDHPTQWLAIGVLAPGRVITVTMRCPDDSDAEGDKAALTAILKAISIRQ